MGEVFQTVPLKTKAWLTKRFLFTPFFLKIWNVKPVCLFQFPTVWVFHFGLVFLQVVAFHHFNVPRHAALSLSLSPFTSCCLCYSERMLPVCDASRESSTCVLLQAAFPLGLILSLLVPTHPAALMSSAISVPFIQALCAHSYAAGDSYFAALILFLPGLWEPAPVGYYTHTQTFVGRICLHASYLNCREPNSGNINICPLSSSCEENRCMSCGAGNVTSRKKRILSDSSCQEISFKRGSMWTLHILQTYRPVKLHQTEVLFHIKGNKIVLRHKAKLCTVKVVING